MLTPVQERAGIHLHRLLVMAWREYHAVVRPRVARDARGYSKYYRDRYQMALCYQLATGSSWLFDALKLDAARPTPSGSRS